MSDQQRREWKAEVARKKLEAKKEKENQLKKQQRLL